MTFAIRDAKPLDLPYIVDLNDEIQRQHASWYPDDFRYPTDAERMAKYFGRLLQDDTQNLLVATVGEEIVAYLWYEIHRRRRTPHKQAMSRLEVHHVFVRPSHRRQGIAAGLFDYVRRIAVAESLRDIALSTWACNSGAQAFFASQGLEVFKLSLRAKLDAM